MPPGSPLAPLTTHTERDCVTPLRATVCHYTGVFCVPLNLLIAAASILAFVRDPDSDTMSGNSFINAGNISIVVGCIAALSVFWNSVERLRNFKSRTDMHEAANQLCKELLRDLVRYQSLSNAERKDSEKPWGEQALDGIKAKLDHVQLSCTSSIPDAISQAFKRLNTFVTYDLEINGLDKADRDDAQKLRIANVLLCNEITKSWRWPMFLPYRAAITRSARDELTKVVETKEKAATPAAVGGGGVGGWGVMTTF